METKVTTSTTSIKLDPTLKDRVARLASARRRSSHWLMREAIAEFVDREEKREALDRDTVAAWEEYERTGLHLTGEEVDAWLARVEAGEDCPPPECHN